MPCQCTIGCYYQVKVEKCLTWTCTYRNMTRISIKPQAVSCAAWNVCADPSSACNCQAGNNTAPASLPLPAGFKRTEEFRKGEKGKHYLYVMEMGQRRTAGRRGGSSKKRPAPRSPGKGFGVKAALEAAPGCRCQRGMGCQDPCVGNCYSSRHGHTMQPSKSSGLASMQAAGCTRHQEHLHRHGLQCLAMRAATVSASRKAGCCHATGALKLCC